MKEHRELNPAIDFPLASRRARIAAFLMDSLFSGVLTSTISALFGVTLSPLTVIIPYFVICHARFGQTLGKKVFGLKVVANDGGQPSLGALLVRESIGRILDYLILGLGVVRALVATDRSAFHDLVSKTKVVQISAVRHGRAMPAWKMFAISVGGLAGVAAIIFYVTLFTSYPLKEWAKNLEFHGIEVHGIKGSLATGIQVDRFTFNDDTGDVELNDIRLDYDFLRYITKNEIVINNISVSDGRVEAKSAKDQSLDEKIKDDFTQPSNRRMQKKSYPRITIKTVDIGKIAFKSPLSPNFMVDRFLISNFDIKDGEVSVERIWVQSDGVDLDVNKLIANQKMVSTRGPLTAVLKPGLFPKHLKADADLLGHFSIGLQSKQVHRLKFAALEKRIQVKKVGNVYEFSTYGLNLRKYLVQSPPLSNINLKVAGAWPQINVQNFGGSFQIRDQIFNSTDGPSFVHVRGNKEFRVVMLPMNFIGLMAGGKVVAVSEVHADLNDWLSDLYFDKPFASLVESEQNQIQSDANFYTFRITGERSLPLAKAPAPDVTPNAIKPPLTADSESAKSKKEILLDTLEQKCKAGHQSSCNQVVNAHILECKKGNTNSCARGQVLLDGRPLRLPAKTK